MNSLAPTFHRPGALRGTRLTIPPSATRRFGPMPEPPSPMASETPSAENVSWWWQVAQAMLRLPDRIGS